jgi:hypothetical protein
MVARSPHFGTHRSRIQDRICQGEYMTATLILVSTYLLTSTHHNKIQKSPSVRASVRSEAWAQQIAALIKGDRQQQKLSWRTTNHDHTPLAAVPIHGRRMAWLLLLFHVFYFDHGQCLPPSTSSWYSSSADDKYCCWVESSSPSEVHWYCTVTTTISNAPARSVESTGTTRYSYYSCRNGPADDE